METHQGQRSAWQTFIAAGWPWLREWVRFMADLLLIVEGWRHLHL